MIVLYTTFYRDRDQTRQQELELALSRNILNSSITKIKLFVDNIDDYQSVSGEKVSLVQCPSKIPSYGDFLAEAANEMPGTVVVISNTDICFDQTLSQVLEWDLAGKLLVITRKEGLPEESPLLTEHYMSSDAWIFRAPPLARTCPYSLGKLHCESIFLGFMQNKGYSIHNVSLEINGFHIHASNKRNYDPQKDRYTDFGRMVYPVISSAYIQIAQKHNQKTFPYIIDGGIFASENNAGKRVWHQLLHALSESPLKEKLALLNRGGLNPHLYGLRVIEGPTFNPHLSLTSTEVLDNICIKHGTKLFIQTTANGPTTCPTIVPFYDMSFIQTSVDRLQVTSHYLSAATCKHAIFFHEDARQYFLQRFPRLGEEHTTLLKLGLPSTTIDASEESGVSKYGVRLPYLLHVGDPIGPANYRNAESLLRALDESGLWEHFQVFFLGWDYIDDALRIYESGRRAVTAVVPDTELESIYSGAFAHVSTSRFKGLETSVLESMRYLCPSIIIQYDQPEREYWQYALVSDQLQGPSLLEMIELLSNEKFRQSIICGAKRYVDSLSWSMAAETLKNLLSSHIEQLETPTH